MSTLSVDTIQGKTTAGSVDMPSGSVVQQVNSLDNAVTANRTYQNTTSTSFTHMTNFDIKITPKFASSKILYFGAFNFYAHANAQYGYVALHQHISGGSATIVAVNSTYGSGIIGPSMYHQIPVMHMMTPNTTNEITYKMYTRAHNSSGAVYLGWDSGTPNDNATNFFAMEIRA